MFICGILGVDGKIISYGGIMKTIYKSIILTVLAITACVQPLYSMQKGLANYLSKIVHDQLKEVPYNLTRLGADNRPKKKQLFAALMEDFNLLIKWNLYRSEKIEQFFTGKAKSEHINLAQILYEKYLQPIEKLDKQPIEKLDKIVKKHKLRFLLPKEKYTQGTITLKQVVYLILLFDIVPKTDKENLKYIVHMLTQNFHLQKHIKLPVILHNLVEAELKKYSHYPTVKKEVTRNIMAKQRLGRYLATGDIEKKEFVQAFLDVVATTLAQKETTYTNFYGLFDQLFAGVDYDKEEMRDALFTHNLQQFIGENKLLKEKPGLKQKSLYESWFPTTEEKPVIKEGQKMFNLKQTVFIILALHEDKLRKAVSTRELTHLSNILFEGLQQRVAAIDKQLKLIIHPDLGSHNALINVLLYSRLDALKQHYKERTKAGLLYDLKEEYTGEQTSKQLNTSKKPAKVIAPGPELKVIKHPGYEKAIKEMQKD